METTSRNEISVFHKTGAVSGIMVFTILYSPHNYAYNDGIGTCNIGPNNINRSIEIYSKTHKLSRIQFVLKCFGNVALLRRNSSILIKFVGYCY